MACGVVQKNRCLMYHTLGIELDVYMLANRSYNLFTKDIQNTLESYINTKLTCS